MIISRLLLPSIDRSLEHRVGLLPLYHLNLNLILLIKTIQEFLLVKFLDVLFLVSVSCPLVAT